MRILKSLLAIIICSSTFAQNIPNGDFENWEKRDHFKLDNWYSPYRNVERTTDAKVGNYALKLTNTYSENGNGYKGYIRNLDYNNRDSINGFAVSGDPLSLVFWSKHDLADGDTARVYIIFRDHGVYKGKVDFRFTGSSNDKFVKYSVPISWNGSRTPDSAWIYLYSYLNAKVNGDGYVIYDDMHFEKIGERMPDFTNHDFEDWTNIGNDYPVGWRTFDLWYYENYVNFLPERTSFKVSGEDAYIGDYALKVTNYYSGKPRYTYHYTGTENNDFYTPVFPVNDTFKFLQGYYKYFPEGNDTARLIYRTWENRVSRSYDNLYLPKAENWTFFKMPINYYTSAAMPDSATILFYSAFTDSVEGAKSTLFLDGLELVMNPKAVTVKEFNNTIEIYPNPTSNTVTIISPESGDLYITNLAGQLMQNQLIQSGTNKLSLNGLNPGVYFFTFNTKNKKWTTKILKQ